METRKRVLLFKNDERVTEDFLSRPPPRFLPDENALSRIKSCSCVSERIVLGQAVITPFSAVFY